ncbi:MAG: carbohydrate ABC transporter permease [Armatimonadota bacterium]
MSRVLTGTQVIGRGSLVRTAVRDAVRGWGGYLFVLPLLIIFVPFVLYPLLRTMQLVFYRYEYITIIPPVFVGLGNLRKWIQDPRVPETMWITVKFILLYVPASTLVALAAALLLDRIANRRLSGLYRTILYFPVVLPAAIVFHMWKWMYDPTLGLFNQVFQALHIPWPWTGWLVDVTMALPAIALMSIWRLMGTTMMLFLVGLANIPNDLLEAARLDGASEWKLLTRIQLPLLVPIFFLILVLRLQVLGLAIEPLVMTEGGPIRATMTYGLQAYFISLRDGNWDMGYGSTWFVVLGLLSTVLAVMTWRLMRSRLEDA